MSVGALEVQLDLDNMQFIRGIRTSSAAVTDFESRLAGTSRQVKDVERSVDSLGDSLRAIRNVATAAFAFDKLAEGFKSLLDAQIGMQQIKYGLQGALGSSKAAAEAYTFVSLKAGELGLNLQSAASEFTKLTAAASAMNVPMKQQQELFDGLARSATVMHLSTDQVKFATMALSQMFSKGKIQAEELRRQLGEHIPGVVPRFQQAVEKMNKGTDLAGVSLDTLMMKGQLTTDKYLPALIAALQATGSGAEEAAQGLNANLNRLSSSWFKFKGEMTTGMFSDSVSAGARALADNMALVANSTMAAVAAMAALKTANFLGGAATQLQGKVGSAVTTATTSRANAAATTQERVAIQSLSQARLADLKITQEVIVAARAEALAKLQAAQADMTAAQTAFKSAKSWKVPHMMVAAEDALTAAKLRQAAATNELAALGVSQTRSTQALAAAQIELAAATEAVTVAQRSQRALGFMPTVTAGLKNAGGALLGLVGGPWGLLILSVGALGMAYANMIEGQKQAEEQFKSFNKEIDKQLGAMALLHQQTKTYAAGDIPEMAKSLGAAQSSMADLHTELAKVNIEMKANQSALAKSKDTNGIVPGLGSAISWMMDYQSKIEASKEKSDELTNKIKEMAARMADLTNDLKKSMPAAEFEKLKAALPKIGDFNGLDELVAKLRAAGLEAEAVATSITGLTTSLKDYADKNKFALITQKDGKAASMLAQELDKLSKASKDGKTYKTIADLPENLQASLTAAYNMAKQSETALKDNKSSVREVSAAQKAAKQADEERTAAIKRINDSLKDQTDVNNAILEQQDKLTPTQRLAIKLQNDIAAITGKGAEAIKAELLARVEKMKVTGQDVLAMQQAEKAAAALARTQEDLANAMESVRIANLNALSGVGMGDQEKEKANRQLQIQLDYAQKIKELGRQKLAPTDTSYIQQKAEIDQYLADRLAAENDLQTNLSEARGNWRNGVSASMQNFAAETQNVASQVQSFTNNTLNGMTDSLTAFATTSKFTFKDMLIDLLKQITRFMMQKAVLGLFGNLLGSFAGGAAGAQTTATAQATGNFGAFNPNVAGFSVTGSANGNVMTDAGPLPLKKYEKGGIAKRPQLSLFGEGKMPEAYVPLPDGRSIPVTMSGETSGGNSVANSVAVNVTVNQDGSSSTDTQGTGDAAKQLGVLIGRQVKDVMAKELKQGGLLWKMKNG
jgi:lambda family phage tail tape measure protein